MPARFNRLDACTAHSPLTRFACLLAILGASLTGCANEPDQHTVSGAVRNGYGDPVPRATLACAGQSQVTDADGLFNFSGLSSGVYSITCQHPDYMDYSSPPITISGHDVDLSVRLYRSWHVDVPVRDTYTQECRIGDACSDSNYGGLAFMLSGRSIPGASPVCRWYSLIGFDCGVIPAGAMPTVATLSLTQVAARTCTLRVDQLLSPWAEDEVTYYSMPARQWSNVLRPVLCFSGVQPAITLDLLAYMTYVQTGGAYPYGLAISSELYKCALFTREDPGGNGPKLGVDFTY